MADGTPKRLAPDERKAAILSAAISLLARKGLEEFSLEAVAREAGVALSLPRHYFGGYRDLLKAATEDLLKTVEKTLLGRDITLDIESRVNAYMDLLAENPWGHQVWMRSPDIHPDVDAIVRKARRRMAESMYRKTWRELSKDEQFDVRGRIGYVEGVVADWLDRGAADRDIVSKLIVGKISLYDKKKSTLRKLNGK